MHPLTAFLFLLLPLQACTQPLFTTNNAVPAFDGEFGYGANLGYYPPFYYDKELAALAHGTPDGRTPGVGVTTIRPGLFDNFLDFWGYNIRKDAFQYYDSIGLKDNAVIIGFPAERNRDQSFYCPGQQTEVFKGMYEPIWDSGENGTPVNDANTYALYVWKMASVYSPHVRFWEVWNEPDVDNGNAWKPAGTPGNWWENAPEPCETKLKAPIFFYIRLLRISYEVIKTIDPQDYVCVGGLGWPSYLDLICRYTDNPFDGTVDAPRYPLTGGAYFDCMSFHSYPHLDNSLREWSNDLNNFRYFRHSDAAVDGVWRLKAKFADVLAKYGYNNTLFPAKQWMVSEVNLPRKAFGDYLGSEMAQTNFIMKTLITAQMEGVIQVDIYSLSDEKPEAEATSEFAYMGLFKNLNNLRPYTGEKNTVATGYKTTSDLLRGKRFDKDMTEHLQLPSYVRGGAFRDGQGKYTYVLWAATHDDRSEIASTSYTFPGDLDLKYLEQRYWHFSESGTHHIVNPKQVLLDGSPVFLTESNVYPSQFPKQPKVLPNPLAGGVGVFSFWMFEDGRATAELFDAQGRKIQTLVYNEWLVEGPQQRLLQLDSLPRGTYFIRLQTIEGIKTTPFIKD